MRNGSPRLKHGGCERININWTLLLIIVAIIDAINTSEQQQIAEQNEPNGFDAKCLSIELCYPNFLANKVVFSAKNKQKLVHEIVQQRQQVMS